MSSVDTPSPALLSKLQSLDGGDRKVHALHKRLWNVKTALTPDRIIKNLECEGVRSTAGQLVVTQEYELFKQMVYDALDERFKDFSTVTGQLKQAQILGKGGVVILGNPGEGKSVFLDYLYYDRLTHGLPVIYLSKASFAVHLDEEHCYGINAGPLKHTGINTTIFEDAFFANIPVLIDSDDKLQPPPAYVVGSCCWAFPVQAASPAKERYHKWAQKRFAPLKVMNPPSLEELWKILRRYRSPPDDCAQLEKAVNKWGVNIRTLADLFRAREHCVQMSLESALAGLSADRFRQLATIPQESKDTFSYSNSIVTTYRQEGSPAYSCDRMYHRITSPHVWRIYMQALHIHRQVTHNEMYSIMTSARSLGVARGQIFESIAHGRFLEGGTFKVTPMRLNKASTHLVKTDSSSDRTFPALGPKIYSASTLVSATCATNTYYMPAEGDNPTFDSFAALNGGGVGFQMTVGRTHTLNSKGLRLLSSRLQRTKPADFFFVIPKDSTFSVPAPDLRYQKRFRFSILEIEVSTAHVNFTESSIDRVCDGDPQMPDDAAEESDEDNELEPLTVSEYSADEDENEAELSPSPQLAQSEGTVSQSAISIADAATSRKRKRGEKDVSADSRTRQSSRLQRK